MGHLLPPESVKITITIMYHEETVSKSSLTPNTPTALLTHPFPSAPFCLASSPPRVLARCSGDPRPQRAAAGPRRSSKATQRRSPRHSHRPRNACPYGYRLGATSGPVQRRVTTTRHRSSARRSCAAAIMARAKQ